MLNKNVCLKSNIVKFIGLISIIDLTTELKSTIDMTTEVNSFLVKEIYFKDMVNLQPTGECNE